jgi:AbiV family abortive infection protein
MNENEKNDDENIEYMKSGIDNIVEHTDQLLKDSELLIKKKRYSASIPLSIFAIEEIGKSNFLESLIKLKKPLTKELWKEITGGGIAHVKKTTGLIVSEKTFLDSSNPEKDEKLNEIMTKLGIPFTDTKMAKIHNMLRKATYLRLENIKHDCLYVNKNGNNWINFNNRFSNYEQSTIATYLFVIALRTHISHKFSLKIPQKLLNEYSEEDIKKSQKIWKKEINPIMKKTDSKKIGRLVDHGMLFLHNNYSPDKRGYVTEKLDGWLDLDY